MKPVYTNPHLEAVRKAFRSSPAYQRMQGVVTPAVRELVERVPGEDDGTIYTLPVDPLEVEMQNGGKP